RLHPALYGGRKAGTPDCRFAVVAVPVSRRGRLDSERFCVGGVTAGGDEDLLKSGASSDQFRTFGFWFGLRGGCWVGVAGDKQRQNGEQKAEEIFVDAGFREYKRLAASATSKVLSLTKSCIFIKSFLL